VSTRTDRLSFARELRRQQTDAERRIWRRLRRRQLHGLKFRRQHPIGPYYADFVCVEIGLIVELDGGQHAGQSHVAHDLVRTDFLVALGYELVRFWDNDVLRDTDVILAAIAMKAEALTRAAPDLLRKREK